VSKGTCTTAPGKSVTSVVLVLVLAGLLLAVAACEDLTSTSPTVASVVDTATTTTIPVTATQATTAASATTTVTEPTTTSEPPALYLDESDYGREVELHVGDRVRIDLHPTVDDRVSSVVWNYEPIIVHERDSGSEKVSDRVVRCWLELEALATGRVTIRVGYEHSYGTSQTPWVVYMEVTD